MIEETRPTQDLLEPVARVAPVVPNAPDRRAGRARWLVAVAAALVILAVSAAGLYALVGAAAGSTVAKWAPADSLVFVEVRGDLPGDQRQNLGRFLAHFPGFADQSTLDQKLDETLDRLVSRASDGKQDWTKGIKPWFVGQAGLAVTDLPSRSASKPSAGHELLIATISDPAGASAWIAGLGGPAPSDQAYAGTTLHVVTMDGEQGAWATTPTVLLAGDVASVKAALDRNGSDGLAGVDTFKTAMASLKGDQLVRTYVDTKRYLEGLRASLPAAASAMPGLGAEALAKLPAWTAAGLRVDEDALAGTTVVPHLSGSSATNASSAIAAKVPGSTVLLAEAHGVGDRIAAALAAARKDPASADALKKIDGSAAIAGGLDSLTGWIGDAGIVAIADGNRPSMGLVIVPTDPTKAAATLASVKNLLALGGASTGVTVREESYAGATISIFDVGDVQKLLGGSATTAFAMPISGHLEIAVGVRDDVVAIGIGDAFVKAVLDTKAGASLADQATYRDALDRVGARNAGSVYLDIAGARALAEPFIAASPDGASYQKELRPYLEPFSAFAAALVVGDSVDSSNAVLVVRQP